jgi:RNA polymerase sigma-B factor
MSEVAVRPIRADRVESDRPDPGSTPLGKSPASGVVDEPGREASRYDPLLPLLAELVGLDRDDPRRRALREQLTAGFTPVVRNIARRYAGRGEPAADLEQVGTIGLLGALDRFAPAPDRHLLDAFLSYAIPTITGEIRRHFRDHTWPMRVPRRLKDLQVPVRAAVESLSTTLRRAPRPSEVAARLGCPVEEVIEVLQAQEAYSTAPLDAPAVGGMPTLVESLGRIDPALNRIEHRQALRQALAGLPERERRIIILRFFDDLSQTQIGARTGLSQMHVSRLLSQTLGAIRHQMNAR